MTNGRDHCHHPSLAGRRLAHSKGAGKQRNTPLPGIGMVRSVDNDRTTISQNTISQLEAIWQRGCFKCKGLVKSAIDLMILYPWPTQRLPMQPTPVMLTSVYADQSVTIQTWSHPMTGTWRRACRVLRRRSSTSISDRMRSRLVMISRETHRLQHAADALLNGEHSLCHTGLPGPRVAHVGLHKSVEDSQSPVVYSLWLLTYPGLIGNAVNVGFSKCIRHVK